MSKIIDSNPKKDGYFMPAEFEKHEATYILWPERTDNWRNGAIPAKKVFANVANTIAKFERVVVGVNANQYEAAFELLNDNVTVVEISNNDSWVRDCGPTVVKNKLGKTRAVNWKFNAWGGLEEGLYFPWDKDDKVAIKIANLENLDIYNAPFVLEGGSIHVDGKGTLFTTEECLLNKNRNPHLNKKQIENLLKDYLGVTKIIWIKKGTFNDETNGHVDNLIHISEQGEVLLNWTDKKSDPQYKISLDAYNLLSKAKDAKGKKLKIIKVPIPDPMVYITKEEANGVDKVDGTLPRLEGDRMAATYLNHYIVNGAVLLPIFNVPTDKKAIEILAKAYPSRKIVPIKAREIILGGGNIHCITQQIPQRK